MSGLGGSQKVKQKHLPDCHSLEWKRMPGPKRVFYIYLQAPSSNLKKTANPYRLIPKSDCPVVPDLPFAYHGPQGIPRPRGPPTPKTGTRFFLRCQKVRFNAKIKPIQCQNPCFNAKTDSANFWHGSNAKNQENDDLGLVLARVRCQHKTLLHFGIGDVFGTGPAPKMLQSHSTIRPTWNKGRPEIGTRKLSNGMFSPCPTICPTQTWV